MVEELKKGGRGGVKVGGDKVYTLVYAYVIAALAEDKEGMNGLLKRIETYLKEKGLELNTEK